MITVLLAGALCAGAPVPFPRRDGPRPYDGVWEVRVGRVTCIMEFGAGGAYVCHWLGLKYAGTWRIAGGKLYIKESCQPSSPYFWQHYEYMITGRHFTDGSSHGYLVRRLSR
jgi:hypothetical protein